MPIDQMGLNSLLTMVNPQNNLTALRKQREQLQRKLNQEANALSNQDSSNTTSTDSKQVIVELASIDKQIQQSVYEEETRKLELERLKQEEAMAKNAREREKALAKHERALTNASTAKLFSAISNSSHAQSMAKSGMSFSFGQSFSEANSHSPYSLEGKIEATERDLKESVEYGIAAAEVARRRKKNQVKADMEEAACKDTKKAKKKTVNITI